MKIATLPFVPMFRALGNQMRQLGTRFEFMQICKYAAGIISAYTMDLRDIEYFAVLAEHGQLVRAAEALGLSQPALSLSLRRLEKSARAKLVKRTPKGVELTAVGTALLTHVRRLQLARDDLAREISDVAHGEAGHVRVGTGPATADGFLPRVCSTVMKETPKVTV